MADRYSFQSPFSRGAGSNPWFMAGSVAVTTSVFVAACGFIGLFLFVIEGGYGPIAEFLELSTTAITRVELWRFFTHIIPGTILGSIISAVFFYLLGSQLETLIGRRAFTAMVLAMLLIPAILGALVAVALGQTLPNFGLSILVLGVAAGIVAARPDARGFFGIPFWALITFLFVLQLLGLLAARNVPGIVMLTTTGAIGLIMTKSLGFSTVDWIPSVPLPAAATGQNTAQTTRSPKKSRKSKKKKSASHLTAVPAPTAASEAEIDALLDQVGEHGIESLTKSQKQTLERHSKELRKRRDQ